MKQNKFNIRKHLFNWHMWLGVAFTVPVLLVSVTAIFIAHEKGLGTKEMMISSGWLPGYQESEADIAYFLNDIKAVYQTASGVYYGTKMGLLIEKEGEYEVVLGTEGAEIRDITQIGQSIFAASKFGLFKIQPEDTAKNILKGDIHGIDFNGKTLVASLGKKGMYKSEDQGMIWTAVENPSEQIPSNQMGQISEKLVTSGKLKELTLEKLMLDIHTGKAFLGEGGMWIWIDLIALSLILMTSTGMWMWYRRKYGSKKVNRSTGSNSRKMVRPILKPVINKSIYMQAGESSSK